MAVFLAFIGPSLAELLRAVADFVDVEEPDAAGEQEEPAVPATQYRINARGGFEAID